MPDLIGPRQNDQAIRTSPLVFTKDLVKFRLIDQPRIANSHLTGCYRSERKDQTAKRLRPLARRALMIWRPALVFMRARKPWVRLRRTVEG